MTDETGTYIALSEPTRTFTAQATEAILAGSMVKASGSDDVVSATQASYATSDIKVAEADAAADYAYVVGVAQETCASSGYVSIAQDGLIVRQAAAITPGSPCMQASADYKNYTVNPCITTTAAPYKIGTALTGTSADDKYAIISLNV